MEDDEPEWLLEAQRQVEQASLTAPQPLPPPLAAPTAPVAAPAAAVVAAALPVAAESVVAMTGSAAISVRPLSLHATL